MQFPKIRCAICDKQVDVIELWNETRNSACVIRAQCHGSSDTMTITAYDFLRLGLSGMAEIAQLEGVAFSTQMLNQGVTALNAVKTLSCQGLLDSSGA